MLAKLHGVCVAGEVGVRRGLGDLHARALFRGRREGSQDEAAAPENVAQCRGEHQRDMAMER